MKAFMRSILLFLLCIFLLSACSDKEPDPRKKYKYHVFVRLKDTPREFYAGTTIGLGSCAIIARRVLQERAPYELSGDGWHVICCWWTKESQCQEEHRYQDKNVPYKEWKNNPKYHHIPERQYFFK